MLDDNGDVVIKNGRIAMVDGNELLRQTVESVIGTNTGEWPLNLDEGITFSNILGKGAEEDVIKHEIQQGLQQVDDTFILTSFELVRASDRRYTINATAQNSTGAETKIVTTYG